MVYSYWPAKKKPKQPPPRLKLGESASPVLNWARSNSKHKVVIKYREEGVLLIENNTASWHPLTSYKKLLQPTQPTQPELIYYNHLLITTTTILTLTSEPPTEVAKLPQWMKENNVLSGVFYFPNVGLYIVTPTEARWGISKNYKKEREYVRSLYR